MSGGSSPHPQQSGDRFSYTTAMGVGEAARASGRRVRQERRDVVIYFANVTRWNSRGTEYLTQDTTMGRADVVCIAEHHLKGQRLVQEAKWLMRSGWRTSLVTAVETPSSVREGPGHGGVGVLTQKRLHSRPLTPALEEAAQSEEMRGVPTQWTSTLLRLQGYDVVIVVLYLAPGLGVQGANWITLSEVADYIHAMGAPFLILGDFNNVVEELLPTGLDKYLGGSVEAARGSSPRRTQVDRPCPGQRLFSSRPAPIVGSH